MRKVFSHKNRFSINRNYQIVRLETLANELSVQIRSTIGNELDTLVEHERMFWRTDVYERGLNDLVNRLIDIKKKQEVKESK